MSTKSIMKCIIVEDEPLAKELLARYVNNVSSLQLAGEFSTALDALTFLQQNEVDVIFLDIQMPHLSGIEFAKALRNPPYIIFTTAFSEYAVQGFDLDAIDYLLKPIQFERFLKAVNKLFQQSGMKLQQQGSVENVSGKNQSYLYFRVDRKMVKVMLDEILYVEGMGNYVKIVTTTDSIITKNTITAMEAMLARNTFLRIHKSFIVSKKKIKSFDGELIQIGSSELPIGKLYKNSVLNTLNERTN